MSTPGKKRRVISLDVKQKIIAGRKEGKTLANLAKEFDLPKQSVQTILSNKEAIQDSIDEGSDAKRARFNQVKHESLEEGILLWVKDVRSQNIPVTGPLMAKKARILTAELASKSGRQWSEKKDRLKKQMRL